MQIKFIIEGQETTVEAEEGHSILNVALLSRLHPPYSCMEGHCGTCEALIESGETSEDKPGSKIVRTCQALPSSEYVVVNYDKGPK